MYDSSMLNSHAVPLPQFQEWSIAAVHLLQGVVYSDDAKTWDIVLSSKTPLESYFARVGLLLVVDEPEGLAYLRQLSDDELPEGYDQLPKLFRKSRLSYDATLLCVLLREELRRFEEEDVHNERCVVAAATLFDQWKSLFSAHQDEVRLKRNFDSAVRSLDDLKFIRQITAEPEEWEIRRILKARVRAADLESLRDRLLTEAARRGSNEPQASR